MNTGDACTSSTGGNILESSFDFAEDTQSIRLEPLDFSRLPLCECASSFLSWVQDRYGSVLADPTEQRLQQAIVAITKEYQFRKYPAQSEPHPLNTCVREVYADVLKTLREKQEELRRHPPQHTNTTPRLYIGQEKEE